MLGVFRTGGVLRRLRQDGGARGRIFVRHLTGPQVSTALRPFYFLVHPDLFGKFPAEQSQNEKSLKILKNYVDTLLYEKKKPNPAELKFFIKPRGTSGPSRRELATIKIRLRDTKMKGLLVTILNSADLPTQYVDSVQEKEGDTNAETIPDFSDPFGDEGFPEQSSTGFSSTDKKQPLVGWLQANVDIARHRLEIHCFLA